MAAHNRKKQGNPKHKLARKQVQAELALPTPAPVVKIVKEAAPWPFPTAAEQEAALAQVQKEAERLSPGDPGLWYHPVDLALQDAEERYDGGYYAVPDIYSDELSKAEIVIGVSMVLALVAVLLAVILRHLAA